MGLSYVYNALLGYKRSGEQPTIWVTGAQGNITNATKLGQPSPVKGFFDIFVGARTKAGPDSRRVILTAVTEEEAKSKSQGQLKEEAVIKFKISVSQSSSKVHVSVDPLRSQHAQCIQLNLAVRFHRQLP